MGKRCQVCDGPIVNGRCKYCGMPYRNDMELYHLNEDRSEHYRHASAKVRKAMKESEVPLPDRNKTAKKTTKVNAAGTQIPKARTARAQNAGTKASAGRAVHTQTARTYTTGQSMAQNTKTKKSKKGSTVFWVIVMVLMVLAGQIVENWDSIGYQIESFIEDEFGIDIGSLFAESGTSVSNVSDREISNVKFSSDELLDYECYFINTDAGSYVIGESYTVEDDDEDKETTDTVMLEPGEYVFEAGWEEVALQITDASGELRSIEFDKAKQQKKVELYTGDEIEAVSLDSQYNYLAMYKIQQNDE